MFYDIKYIQGDGTTMFVTWPKRAINATDVENPLSTNTIYMYIVTFIQNANHYRRQVNTPYAHNIQNKQRANN